MAGMTVRAVVLRAADYKEYDRILTLFAHGYGEITAAARFSRRLKSPLLNVTVPFVSGEFVLTERQGRYTVASCSVDDAHYALRKDPLRLASAAYLCALCEEVVQPGQPDDDLYTLLLRALAHLCHGDSSPDSVTLCFLLRMLDMQGVAPILTRCSRCSGTKRRMAFDARGAGAVCLLCSPGLPPIDLALLAKAEALRGGEFSPPETVEASLFDMIADYATAHFERSFKTLSFLQRMRTTFPAST